MSLQLLCSVIRTRCTGDTGAGGLFETGAPLVTGFYTLAPPQAGYTFPFILLVPVADSEDKVFDTAQRSQEYLLQFSVFVDRTSTLAAGQAIIDRLQVRVDRWAPTVTGWSPSQLIRTGGRVFEDDESRHWVEEYFCRLSK